jgi:hypothetical protein
MSPILQRGHGVGSHTLSEPTEGDPVQRDGGPPVSLGRRAPAWEIGQEGRFGRTALLGSEVLALSSALRGLSAASAHRLAEKRCLGAH